jgi:hypothetical protein
VSTPHQPPPAGPNGPPQGPVPPPYGAPPPPYGQQAPQPGWGQQPTPAGWAAPQQPGPGQQPYGVQPAFGQQVPAPPPGKGGGKVKLVLTVLVVAALAVGGYFLNRSGPTGANPGDCINIVSASITDPKIEKVECGAANAAYKVAKNLDSASD